MKLLQANCTWKNKRIFGKIIQVHSDDLEIYFINFFGGFPTRNISQHLMNMGVYLVTQLDHVCNTVPDRVIVAPVISGVSEACVDAI